MDKYFVVTDGDVRMVAWGNPEAALEASPMVLCPPIIPAEIVDAFCSILTEKDPEGKLGGDMQKFIEAELKAAEVSPEMQGAAPGEEFSGEMFEGDANNGDGPFKV
jgi:hypothetical protein